MVFDQFLITRQRAFRAIKDVIDPRKLIQGMVLIGGAWRSGDLQKRLLRIIQLSVGEMRIAQSLINQGNEGFMLPITGKKILLSFGCAIRVF